MNFPKTLFHSFEIDEQHLPASTNEEEKFRAFRQLLIQRIDELIHRDMEKLKWILYRIDVSEKKLGEALKTSETDAATIIADMIIQRQIEKAESRKKFGEQENDWNFDV
ncbi:MAG: hypothetical protein KIS94_09205 [Chitinophagales bacterium]|nr:hypothetical protein [Chitinophagales bacterium]